MAIVRTKSPDEQSLYQSQWARYQRALDITPDYIRTAKASGGDTLDIRFYSRPEFLEKDQEFDYRVTGRLINEDGITFYEDEAVEIADGRLTKSLGRYFWLEGDRRISQLEGNYIVINTNGQTIGIVTSTGSVVGLGLDIFRGELKKGTAIGYRCTCPDYSQGYNNLLRTPYQWGNIGALGACKHILAVRIIRKELIAIPADVPTISKTRERSQFEVSGGRRGKVKKA